MVAEILSIGTELLLGQVLNSDAQYLSQRLSELGIAVYHHTTVGDNPARIIEALNVAIGRADRIVTTGGLGPTEDDLTKQMVSEVLGVPLVMHEPSLAAIQQYMLRGGRKMADNNRKQAYTLKGGKVLPNRRGTAPGCAIEKDGKMITVLPGPPRELKDMFERELLPLLSVKAQQKIVSRYLKVFGIGESDLENRLSGLFSGSNPTLALYCGTGEVAVRVTAMCGQHEDPGLLMEPIIAQVQSRLGDAIYAEGYEATMPNTVLELLKKEEKTLALAESCTGGMIASRLVDYPGASPVLVEGHITYHNEAKARVLGVLESTLKEHGAVSSECALEMARGAKRISGADYGLSVTGIAGPEGGTPEKPVGLVYVGIADEAGEQMVKLQLSGDRNRIRQLTCLHALNILRHRLLEKAGTETHVRV